MKYVRTKDGRIIDISSKDYIINNQDLILHEQYQTVGGLPSNPKSMIQVSVAVIEHHKEYHYVGTIDKEADTIEELCDEFVCFENKMTFQDLETITSSCNLKHLTVYGAIWTEWGLKYVAKMNYEGELELL